MDNNLFTDNNLTERGLKWPRIFGTKHPYEEIIWDLLEDTMELSEETKKDIAEAREDIRKGRVYTLDQVKKEADL